jgi:hypothetical protein
MGARPGRPAAERSADIGNCPETSWRDASRRAPNISTTRIVATLVVKNPLPIHCRKLSPSSVRDVSMALS